MWSNHFRPKLSHAGLINIVLGVLLITSTLMSGPYAFGSKWYGVIVLVGAGVLNIILGIWVVTRKSPR